jgi:hypothetical protein
MVPTGTPGGGYAIDAEAASNNPIYYNTGNLGATQDLKDTPMSPPTTKPGDPSQPLLNSNYQLGFCYKKNPKDKDEDKLTQEAKLTDKARSRGKARSQTFETAALAIEGDDKNKYYGSVKWGYKLDGPGLNIVPSDIELASPPKAKPGAGTPTENFTEAAKVWNTGEAQGTLKVLADVQVRIVDPGPVGALRKGQVVTLNKDAKVRQVAAALQGEEPAIVVETLRPDGTGTGIQVGVKNSEVVDAGGDPNKQLPVPASTATTQQPPSGQSRSWWRRHLPPQPLLKID